MKLRRIDLERLVQQWVNSEHGAYTRGILPVPTKTSSNHTRPFDDPRALPHTDADRQDWPARLPHGGARNSSTQNPLRNPARCSACVLGNQDTQQVLLTCSRFTDLRLHVLGPGWEREGLAWKDWLTQPTSTVKAAIIS